jgi:hypothetical protein
MNKAKKNDHSACLYLKARAKVLLFSLFHALWVLFLCYLLGNTSYSLGDEESFVQYLNLVKEQVFPSHRPMPRNVLIVNVAYDKQLVDVSDEYGIPLGQTAITERGKLLRFLQAAREADTYQYILLDVFFEEGLHSPEDSALFSTIAGMDRIVIPRHKGMQLADSSLLPKSAYSEYYTSINEGNFVKYEYWSDEGISIPVKMFVDCMGARFSHFGPFYSCDGKLCGRCLFLNFPVRIEGAYDGEGEKLFYNLGSDLLDEASHLDLSVLLKNKYIVVGNMVEDDIHDTYVGAMPGAIINLNAFYALVQGRHYVAWFSMLVLFVVYFLITLFLVKGASLFSLLPWLRKVHSRTWQFVFSWFGLSTLLCTVCIAFYFLVGEVYDILVIATYFSLFSVGVKFYYIRKQR